MDREKIDISTPIIDLIVVMAEGNPGAIGVMTQLMKKDPVESIIWILSLDDMNIRGSQIWLGYKDFCNQDIDKFIDCIKNRDQGMVNKINEEGLQGNHDYKAVTGGASFREIRERL